MEYTGIDRILSKVQRDLRGTNINETDVIEWIGEAMEFLKVPEIQEQAVSFLKVEDYETNFPPHFQMVLQIAKYDKSEEEVCNSYKKCDEKNLCDPQKTDLKCIDCCGKNGIIDMILGEYDTSFRPYFDMQWQYISWAASTYYKEHFEPVRLANNTFFNSIVCKENNVYKKPCGNEEYTVVGTYNRKLRFSFKEGYIALSYIKSAIDNSTGYPLIPDQISFITAITYYIKWKISERRSWDGRQGAVGQVKMNYELWTKYVGQAKNWARMPKTIDDFQNLMEESHHLIPKYRRYYNYFGNLGRPETRKFSNPDERLRRY